MNVLLFHPATFILVSWQSYLKYVADDATTGNHKVSLTFCPYIHVYIYYIFTLYSSLFSLPSVLEQKLGDADVFALTPKWAQELILTAIHGNNNARLIKEIMSSVDLVSTKYSIKGHA